MKSCASWPIDLNERPEMSSSVTIHVRSLQGVVDRCEVLRGGQKARATPPEGRLRDFKVFDSPYDDGGEVKQVNHVALSSRYVSSGGQKWCHQSVYFIWLRH